MTGQRFCVDCRWHKLRQPAGEPICVAPMVDVVTGADMPGAVVDLGCYTMRAPTGFCGRDGALWEKK